MNLADRSLTETLLEKPTRESTAAEDVPVLMMCKTSRAAAPIWFLVN